MISKKGQITSFVSPNCQETLYNARIDVVPTAAKRNRTTRLFLLSLCRRFQHFEQEGFNGCVSDEFEKEEMLEAFEADGA